MKKLTLVLIILIVISFISYGQDNPEIKKAMKQPGGISQDELFYLEPGKGNKYINSKTTENDLKALFGKQNVQRQKAENPYNGDIEYYIVLFPESDNRVNIYFKNLNKNNYKNISYIEFYNKNSNWKLINTYGIKLGTTLEQLEKIYGNIIDISFCVGDYEHWFPEFDKSKNQNINYENFNKIGFSIDLYPTKMELTEDEQNRVNDSCEGEKLKSNENLVKKLGLEVSEMAIYFK